MSLAVRFYTKPGCHLCADVRAGLERLGREFPLAVEEIDISRAADLTAQYGERIPVVAVGERECAGRLSDVDLRTFFRAAWGRPPRRAWWSEWIP